MNFICENYFPLFVNVSNPLDFIQFLYYNRTGKKRLGKRKLPEANAFYNVCAFDSAKGMNIK